MGDKHRYGSTGWLYVVLSRVRDISGLFTLVPLSTDRGKYKKRHDVLQEMDRLRAMENMGELDPVDTDVASWNKWLRM